MQELTTQQIDAISGGGSFISDVSAGVIIGGIAGAYAGGPAGIIPGAIGGSVLGTIYHFSPRMFP